MTVTALMPVRRFHPSFLRLALDSLMAQTSADWRLLIVTEPGRDTALSAAVTPYLSDGRIELIVNRGRKLAGAFNTGMQEARTDFVAILLGDDLWSPEAAEILNANIRAHPDVDFFHSSRMVVDEHGAALSSVHRAREEVRLEDFGGASPVKHLLCWRRSKALSFGGMDERLASVGPDDFDFPWSMAEHGAVFRAIPECLYIYRDHRSAFRLTTHLPLSVHTRELRRIMSKHGVDLATIDTAVRAARRSYLRQCLYRSEIDRWLKQRLGRRPRPPWRETYR